MRKKEEMLFYAGRVMRSRKRSWSFDLENMPVICLANAVTLNLDKIRAALEQMPDNMAFLIGRHFEQETIKKDYQIPDRMEQVSKLHCFIIRVKNSHYYQLFDISKNGTTMISEHCRSYKGFTKSAQHALQIFN